MTGYVRTNVLRIDLKGQVREIVGKHSKQTALDIRDHSPKRLGPYADGWTDIMVNDETAVVANTGKNKSLTHLLELGHASKNGGWVAPQEHIRPAFMVNKERYLNDLKSIKLNVK